MQSFLLGFRLITLEVLWLSVGVAVLLIAALFSVPLIELNASILINFGWVGVVTLFSSRWRRAGLTFGLFVCGGGLALLVALNAYGYVLLSRIGSASGEERFRVAKVSNGRGNAMQFDDILLRQSTSLRDFAFLYAHYYRITAAADRYGLELAFRGEAPDLWGPQIALPATSLERAENRFKEVYARDGAVFDSTTEPLIRERITVWFNDKAREKSVLMPHQLRAQYWATFPRERWTENYAAVAATGKVGAIVASAKIADAWFAIRAVAVLVGILLVYMGSGAWHRLDQQEGRLGV